MATTTTRTYQFTLSLKVPPGVTIDEASTVYGCGCDDALLHSEGEDLFLDFDREAESLGRAIGSAIVDVERAGYSVARVDVDGT